MTDWQSGTPPIHPAWFVRPDGYDASGSIHGVSHTRRVWTHAMTLAEMLDFSDWQTEALHYAAVWHDIGRTDDGADYYHGAKSAGKVVALGLHEDVEPLVYETALYAITHHCGSEEHGERAAERVRYHIRSAGGDFVVHKADPHAALRVFQALKDADALDRVRLGDLNVAHLRFRESLELVPAALVLLRELP